MNYKNGVYKITNKLNAKVYIGCGDVSDRIYKHKYYLGKRQHSNSHLQNAWDKYGEENFEFDVLVYCKKKFAKQIEKELIQNYSSDVPEFGYNNTEGGELEKHTEQSKRKISNALRGRDITWGDKISKSKKGSSVSEKVIKKIKENRESFEGENNPFYGLSHSEEAKEKMSKAKQGENGVNTKISSDKVRRIEELLCNTSLTGEEIANSFDVSEACIADISRGETWSDISLEEQ